MPIVLPSPSRPTLTEPTYIKPPVWKPLLAWVGVGFGVLTVAAALAPVEEGLSQSVGLALFGLACLVPGGWWVFCERKDRTHAEEDYRLDQQAARAQQMMTGHVAPDALAPLTWDTPLTPFARRWPLVAAVAVALLIASMVVMPAVESEMTTTSSSSPLTVPTTR